MSGFSPSNTVASSARPRPVDVESGRLRRCHEVFPFDDHVDLAVDREAFGLDDVDGVAVAVEQRGGGHDELQLEIGMVADGFERRLDARIGRARGDDDADLAFHGFKPSPRM